MRNSFKENILKSNQNQTKKFYLQNFILFTLQHIWATLGCVKGCNWEACKCPYASCGEISRPYQGTEGIWW